MEYGFCEAGEPLVYESERANVVSPPKGKTDEHMMPVQESESGDPEAEENGEGCGAECEDDETVNTDTRAVWEKIQEKAEELQEQVAIHFEDQNDRENHEPPIIKAPIHPIRDQWERHQTNHTPYELCGCQGSEAKSPE